MDEKAPKKRVTSSISQSCNGLLNWSSQHPHLPISLSHKSTTVAFLWEAVLKRVGYASFNLTFSTYLSHQNLVRWSFPIYIEVLTLNSSHPFLKSFQRRISKEFPTPLVVHPPSIFLNFPQMIFLHKLLWSIENLHNPLPSKAWMRPSNLLNPSPPFFLSLHTSSQFIKIHLSLFSQISS